MISLIVAMDKNGVIGKDGSMPWGRLPVDLRYFKQVTTGHTVIMGRKTWESIGSKPLPDRDNIILTKSGKGIPAVLPARTYLSSITEVVSVSINYPNRGFFVIGGGEIYKQFLPYADKLYVTRIHAEFEGDTYFPNINWKEWEVINATHMKATEENPYDCTFYKFI